MRIYVCQCCNCDKGHARQRLLYPYHLCCLCVSKRQADFSSRLFYLDVCNQAFGSNCWRRAMQRRRNRKPGMIRSSRQGHQTAAAPTRLYVRQGDPGSEKTQMAAPEGGYHDGMSKDTAYGEMLTCDSRSFRRASCAAPKPGGQLHISKSAELIRHCRRGSRGWNCGLPCKNSPGGASAASAPPIGGAWSPDSGRVSGGARQPTMLASR